MPAQPEADDFRICQVPVWTSFVDEHQQAGYHELEWDGRDASGARVATGVYLYGLRAGDFRSVRKMVLMK